MLIEPVIIIFRVRHLKLQSQDFLLDKKIMSAFYKKKKKKKKN